MICCWGPVLTDPSLVLAPESALRLLPSRALSSAPAACSVCGASSVAQDGTKKDLIIAALSDMAINGNASRADCVWHRSATAVTRQVHQLGIVSSAPRAVTQSI